MEKGDTLTTTKEAAAQLRQQFKRRGYNSRDISIRMEQYSLGSTIHIEIKTPKLPLPAVKAICKQAEHVRYCEASGEILSGGNRFVEIHRSRELSEILARRHVQAVENALDELDQLETPTSQLVHILGTNGPLMLGLANGCKGTYRLWGGQTAFPMQYGRYPDHIAVACAALDKDQLREEL
jgi:hypothetical protein